MNRKSPNHALQRTVIRGVDEVHAELERAMQNAMRVVTVPTHSPDERSAQAHRAEPHAIYGKITEPDRACSRCASIGRQRHFAIPTSDSAAWKWSYSLFM